MAAFPDSRSASIVSGMRWLYGLLQIGLTLGIAYAGFEGGGRQLPLGGWLVFGFIVSMIATAAVYWTIRGVKRLLGHPPEGRVIARRGAFDNLRGRGEN